MNKKRVIRIVLPAIISIATESIFLSEQCFAITYLSIEQAQASLAPKVSWQELKIELSADQISVIEEHSGVSVLNSELKVWTSPQSDFFVVDTVLGKHEFITYALLISPDGILKGIEILDYRESYGDEIRRPEWRAQFIGKTPGTKIEFEKDILNISGATISCLQITKGVKRILATYETVLKTAKKS